MCLPFRRLLLSCTSYFRCSRSWWKWRKPSHC